MASDSKRDSLRLVGWSSLPLLVITWSLLRLVTFLAAYSNFPYPHSLWLSSDVDLFAQWGPRLAGFHFPIHDDRWQYPPGAGMLLTVPQWISKLLHIHYDQAFQGVVLAADLALLIVLIWAGRRLMAPLGGLAGAWLWALAPLFIGPILAARFDTVTALSAVAAIVLIYTARPGWAGVAASAGLMIKAWPILMLGAAQRRNLPRAVIGALVGAASIATVALLWSDSWSFTTNEVHRGLQIESVAALPWVIGWHFHRSLSYAYQYGSLEITSPLAHPVGATVSLLGVVLILVLVALRVLGRLEHVRGVDVAYTALLVSVATSRVYSPQYDIWLVAVGAAVLLDRRTQLRLAVLFVVIASFAAQMVYPIVYTSLMLGNTWGVLWQVVRVGFLVIATLYAYLRVIKGALTHSPNSVGLDQSQPAAV